MTTTLAGAMRTAAALTSAQKLAEATRVIQDALNGRRPSNGRDPLPEAKLIEGRVIEGHVIEGHAIDLTLDQSTIEHDDAPAPNNSRKGWHRFAQGPLQFDGLAGRNLPAPLPGLDLHAPALLKARKPVEVPNGAQYLSRSFTCTAGTRSYKLYIPSTPAAERRPLVIMLHGGTQDADDFAIGTRMNAVAEELGFIVAYPIQPRAANASLCWNWFLPEHQRRDAGEPAIIAGITRELIAEYDIDASRVFVAGLSAGGAMAAVMGEKYPDLYTGIGVHSGLAYGAASDLPSAFAAMRGTHGKRQRRGVPAIRMIVFHGDADNIVHPSNAAIIVGRQSTGSKQTMQRGAGKTFTRRTVEDRSGKTVAEDWTIHGSGHAWSGGSADGSYTDPHGPDATREMMRFFLESHSQ